MGWFEAAVIDGAALVCRLFDANPQGHEPPPVQPARIPQDEAWAARRLAPSFHQQS